MENKRASGGFIGTATGAVMTALQGTHPEWFGNHPWILPLALIALFVGLLFWITQIPWFQRILGLQHGFTSHSEPAVAETNAIVVPSSPKTVSKLKILWAHYGSSQGPSREVGEEYLQPRICGDSLVGWVGSDLFGPLDPAIGLSKSLKVRYSFNGEEATVERQEHELLVLPEDKFLKEQLETCQRESKLNENQLKAELSRAKECYRQCEIERRDVETKLKIFSPLQIEALQFMKGLRDFLAEYGPRRVVKVEDYPDTPEGILEFNQERDKIERPGGFAFYGQFASRFKEDAEKLYYKFLAAGVTNTHFGSLAVAVNTRSNVEELIEMLWEMIGGVGRDGNEKG